MKDVFLLDSDVFISSHRIHHPFDYKEFHPFWHWMEKMAAHGKVKILDIVFQEIAQRDSKGNSDELADWFRALFAARQISHKTDDIGEAYAQVQDYLVTCGYYLAESYSQWEPEDKADPWLIAAAKTFRATIVTNERPVNPSSHQPMKKEPKIPDVAEALGVPTMNLREFYDASGELIHMQYPIQLAF
jgi:hypothetical protein